MTKPFDDTPHAEWSVFSAWSCGPAVVIECVPADTTLRHPFEVAMETVATYQAEACDKDLVQFQIECMLEGDDFNVTPMQDLGYVIRVGRTIHSALIRDGRDWPELHARVIEYVRQASELLTMAQNASIGGSLMKSVARTAELNAEFAKKYPGIAGWLPSPDAVTWDLKRESPLTPAGKVEFVTSLLNPVDDEGNSLPPMISKADALRLLDLPELDDEPAPLNRWQCELYASSAAHKRLIKSLEISKRFDTLGSNVLDLTGFFGKNAPSNARVVSFEYMAAHDCWKLVVDPVEP